MKKRLSIGQLLSRTSRAVWALGLSVVLLASSCAKKDDSPNPTGTPKYGFQIASGGQSIQQGKKVNLNLTVIDANGAVVAAPGSISYIVQPSGLGAVVNGVFVAGGAEGTGTITATMTVDGVDYLSVVPVVVAPAEALFHVAPSAILWSTGAGNIQLETVYFGTQAPGAITYSVTSGTAVSVSSTGDVSFNSNGSAVIRVSTTIGGKATSVDVPVMVVGPPAAPLPVARVACSPNPVILFRNETQTLAPVAYNGSNTALTGETFTYEVINKDTSDTETGPIVTVSSSGLVTPVRVGSATIIVTCKGISTQVEAEVLPDKVIINNPFYGTLGTDYSDPFNPRVVTEITATASTYTINKQAYRAKDYNNMLVLTANPAGLDWFKPTFPEIPEINNLFDIVNLSAKTNSSVLIKPKSSSSVGSTFVISFDPQDLNWTEPGITAVTVLP